MEINGVLVDNTNDITTHVLEFYKHLFFEQSKLPLDYSLVPEVVPTLVTSKDNSNLTRMPSLEEIHVVVF